jgi:uncharacterized protein YdeI (YjbR/CyaY-like superfamily)
MKKDRRIDAYTDRAQPFARPILEHVRALVHATCPDVEETIKWGMPAFYYAGQPMCGMAAFKAHCTVSFWKYRLIPGLAGLSEKQSMGQFGRVGSLRDLPAKRVLAAYVKAAMKLNDEGVTVARPKGPTKPAAKTPPDLAQALAKNAKARATYEGFPPGQRREYVEWLAEAKRPETRAKRLAQAVAWMAEGKIRNWKYARRG